MTPCMICGKPVVDYEPEYCCPGGSTPDTFCGCMGTPINPCLCSADCGDALFDYIGLPYDERRRQAGIERYKEE